MNDYEEESMHWFRRCFEAPDDTDPSSEVFIAEPSFFDAGGPLLGSALGGKWWILDQDELVCPMTSQRADIDWSVADSFAEGLVAVPEAGFLSSFCRSDGLVTLDWLGAGFVSCRILTPGAAQVRQVGVALPWLPASEQQEHLRFLCSPNCVDSMFADKDLGIMGDFIKADFSAIWRTASRIPLRPLTLMAGPDIDVGTGYEHFTSLAASLAVAVAYL